MASHRTDGNGADDARRRPAAGRAPSAAEARAAVEARRDAVRTERAAAFDAAFGDLLPGRWVLIVSWAVTALFAATTAVALAVDGSADAAFLVVALVLFGLGCGLFGVDIVLAAGRSRERAIGIGGLFLLMGSAPPVVQRNLLGSLAVQVLVAVIAGAVGFARIDDRHLNVLAFASLVPVVGLAACGFWSARWGLFPERSAAPGTAGVTASRRHATSERRR